MCTISWEADFDYKVFEPRQENSQDTATRLLNDATNGTADIYVTEEYGHSSVEDSKRNRAIEKEIRPTPVSGRDETALSDELPKLAENSNDVTESECSDADIFS